MEKAVDKKTGDMHLYCNSCGKELKVENSILKEDVFEVKKEWGYFSDWDTQIHHFYLCEECYRRITDSFRIPVEVIEKVEVM